MSSLLAMCLRQNPQHTLMQRYGNKRTGMSSKRMEFYRGLARNRAGGDVCYQTNVDRAVMDTDVAPVATGSASSLPEAVGSRFGPPY